MSTSKFQQTINASQEKVWEVLFEQYGDIHIHNPTMPTSKYVGDFTKGTVNCPRHVTFDEKLYLEETITEVHENKSFKVVAYKHNLPLLKDMSAVYELVSLGAHKTQVTMISSVTSAPSFMIFLMKGQLGKGLKQHLFGLKYYLETGKTVNKDNYTQVFKNYN